MVSGKILFYFIHKEKKKCLILGYVIEKIKYRKENKSENVYRELQV